MEGNGKERVCLAGYDPASHPVKPVGTQRVALDGDSMRSGQSPQGHRG